jgi:hypothetical protein
VSISLGSVWYSALQYKNAVQARKEAAQAAEKQAADVERSRIAAEDSAASSRVLAETTQRALKLQSRGTTAVEKSTDVYVRSQSARLMVILEPYKDANSGASSRRLLLLNASGIPATRVKVGYEIHTLGMPDQAALAWRLTPNEPEPVSESVDFYIKAMEKLKPQYSNDWLVPGIKVTVADTLPDPKWFFFTISDYSNIPYPHKYASSSFALRPAVVFGYLQWTDNANQSKKVPFCFSLDPKKPDLNCQKVNPTE